MARKRIKLGEEGIDLLTAMAKSGCTGEEALRALAEMGVVLSRATVGSRLREIRGKVHRNPRPPRAGLLDFALRVKAEV